MLQYGLTRYIEVADSCVEQSLEGEAIFVCRCVFLATLPRHCGLWQQNLNSKRQEGNSVGNNVGLHNEE